MLRKVNTLPMPKIGPEDIFIERYARIQAERCSPLHPLPAAPVFAVIGALIGEIGIEDRFFALRDIIVKSDGYTPAIGEALTI